MANGAAPTLDPNGVVTPAQLMALQRELASLRDVVARNVDAMPDEPFYECAEPYYSSDDVYYPAGARFVDITGIMKPNENMIPLNPAAEDRMRAYLNSLPHAQRTPTMDNIAHAIMTMRPKHGDDPKQLAETQARLMQVAFETQYGMGPDDLPPAELRPIPKNRGPVPMMPNTKILGNMDGAVRRNQTRFVSEPIAPAHKTTRVMGGVQSNPLGTEQAGVTGK